MNKNRVIIFLVTFSIINLIFIPLLSIYGLRVCPILSIPGFGFGCYYAGLYIGLILFLNTGMFLVVAFGDRSRGLMAVLAKRIIFTMVGIYLTATIIALIFLQWLLNLNHFIGPSRAPEILVFASLLLGVTQVYGSMWAFHGSSVFRYHGFDESFRKNWLVHVLRTMLPIVVTVLVLLHFLIGQSVSFNNGYTAPPVSNDTMIAQTSYLIYFLLVWLAVTFLFHFLSERDQVSSVQNHLDKLSENLDTKFRSETSSAWGLWRSILGNLNLFSQALSERARLVSAFSKFVSAGVAKDVLSTERLSSAGVTKEMTVLMVDIRNFTGLSEALAPDQVVLLLNEYFSTMLTVVAQFHITVDKFIGDGILAYVESQGSVITEDREAVAAALKMLEGTKDLNARLIRQSLPEIKIGVGIYRGPLVIGLIGTEEKMQHTIIGDTVNRVARLEGLCKELGKSIIISGWIWQSLDQPTQKKFHSFGKHSVKGIAESIDIFGGPI